MIHNTYQLIFHAIDDLELSQFDTQLYFLNSNQITIFCVLMIESF